VQAISLAVEDQEGRFDKPRDAAVFQPTGTPSSIEEFISQAFGLRGLGIASLGRLSARRNVTNWTTS
jgi:hypothetical protein